MAPRITSEDLAAERPRADRPPETGLRWLLTNYGHAREHLAKYKVPRSLDFTDEFPRTETGKLVKRELRDPYWQGRQRAI